ncbi:hypothetical protein PVAG01_00296 [Phlyctema vagabunda]|uniref:Uncharacterized protein n=1 Tax=Phlyctema vagabunda TaxID=108571 RepID=A0ABR4PUF3_9HELO
MNQLFADVEFEDECQEIHDHLFLKLELLDRVIRARKLHHNQFFSMNYNYGHVKFLAQLQSQRFAVTKALERIERRVADMAYGKQKWFKWVRQCQDDDEASQEKGQGKVKKEAALFRRPWKETHRRLRELRAKENQKKQDAFLEEIYRKSLQQQGKKEEEDDTDWDPIEDVVEDNRENFVNLIKRFLWMMKVDVDSMDEVDTEVQINAPEVVDTSSVEKVETVARPVTVEDEEPVTEATSQDIPTPKKSKKSKRRRNLSEWINLSGAVIKSVKAKTDAKIEPSREPGEKYMESWEEMYDRLRHGSEYSHDEIVGLMVAGTVENPVIATKTPPLGEDECQKLLSEIAEIKHLLFCRLLLGQATFLRHFVFVLPALTFFDPTIKSLKSPPKGAPKQTTASPMKIYGGLDKGEENFQYFPGADWANWSGNRYRQQMLQLGFIVYFESVEPDAEALTQSQQSGRRGMFRRSHTIFEVRNFMCAHINRNDPASRRLIQYLAMQAHELLVLVRDAVDGTLIVKSPEEERWLIREKSGLGRASKNARNVLNFKEHYDVYMWDLAVGEPFPLLYNAVQRTLFKAHRCCSGVDFYNPAAPIIKTLPRDRDTHLVRDIKPGEAEAGVLSAYDEIHAEGIRFSYRKLDHLRSNVVKNRIPEDLQFPRGLFYTKADALKNEVLFPEGISEDGPFDTIHLGPMRAFEEKLFSMKKFVEGWETDSQYDSSLDGSTDNEDPDDSAYEDISEDDEEDAHELRSRSRKLTAQENDRNIMDSSGDAPEEVKQFLLQTFKDSVSATKKTATKKKSHKEAMKDMDEGYHTFLDKEKSKIFNEVWHRADLEPQAQEHYIEMIHMTKRSFHFNRQGFGYPALPLAINIMKWLDAKTSDDRRDVNEAVAKLLPFFYPQFFESRQGAKFKDSLIFNQVERAKHYPTMRSGVGNQTQPKEFWTEWDRIKKEIKNLDDIPVERDEVTRPIIARFYKAGVIRNRAVDYTSGKAIAAKEAHQKDYDFLIDWRDRISEVTMPAMKQGPYSTPDFRTTARKFASLVPGARFAVLRLWSAPHFYPLMIGYDNHDMTSFQDLTGRNFIWMFLPRDMPNSEWSMHHTARQRTDEFAQFKSRVVVKRNAFLAMGTDEEGLRRLAIGVTYAI